MEIKIERDGLYRAVSKVQSIIEKRSNMPILSMILVSATESGIEISATDLEISFQQKHHPSHQRERKQLGFHIG